MPFVDLFWFLALIVCGVFSKYGRNKHHNYKIPTIQRKTLEQKNFGGLWNVCGVCFNYRILLHIRSSAFTAPMSKPNSPHHSALGYFPFLLSILIIAAP